jgi:transcriptional regulator with XRE-family HTH domain
MDLGIFQTQTISIQQKMHLGMKLSDFLDQTLTGYKTILQEIESSDVFLKFSFPGENKVISVSPIFRYIPYNEKSNTQVNVNEQKSIKFVEEDEDLDTESMIDKYLKNQEPDLYEKIKSMRIDLFYYYFIEGEGTNSEISELLDIPVEKAVYTRELIDKTLIRSSLGLNGEHNSESSGEIYPEVIAELQQLGETLQISFLRDRLRYRINEDKLFQLINNKTVNPDELKELKTLREKIHLVNSQLNILSQIVENAVKTQEKYIISGMIEDKKILEEKELAGQLGVHFSWISRLINGKSVRRYIMYKNRFIPLRELFVSRRELNKQKGVKLIGKIIKANENIPNETKTNKITDWKIQNILQEEYNLKISRRTVNNWVRELKEY